MKKLQQAGKRYFVLFAAILCMLCSCLGTSQSQKTEVFSPKNTKFAVELHNETALSRKREKRDRLKTELMQEIKKEIFRDIRSGKIQSTIGLITKAFRLRFLSKPSQSAEGYYHIFMSYGKDQLAQGVRDLARAYKVTEGFTELVKQLKEQGYVIQVCSNVGKVFLNDLQQDHPELFKYLEKEGTTVEFTNPDGSFNWNMEVKPEAAFFKKHHNTFIRDTSCKHVIFIDTKKANIDAANEFTDENGNKLWTAVHMPCNVPAKKAVSTVKAKLNKLGIIVQ